MSRYFKSNERAGAPRLISLITYPTCRENTPHCSYPRHCYCYYFLIWHRIIFFSFTSHCSQAQTASYIIFQSIRVMMQLKTDIRYISNNQTISLVPGLYCMNITFPLISGFSLIHTINQSLVMFYFGLSLYQSDGVDVILVNSFRDKLKR